MASSPTLAQATKAPVSDRPAQPAAVARAARPETTVARLMPAGPPVLSLVQRKCACAESPEREESLKLTGIPIQRTENPVARPAIVLPGVSRALRSSGQPLDGQTRRFMESRFGQDFSRVRVHTDSAAAESARGINALAYTAGNNVVFSAGQFAPETSAGKRLLAHELTHVVQQRGGRFASGAAGMTIGPPGNAYEREAETVANRVAAGHLHVADAISTAPQSQIQRYSWNQFVGDLGRGVSTVGRGVVTIGTTVMNATAAAGSWVVTTVGRAAISAATALTSALGGSFRIVGTSIVITIPDINLFSARTIPILTLPTFQVLIPFWGAGVMIGPVALGAAVGVRLAAQPSLIVTLGPGFLRRISVILDPLASRYVATGQFYAGAAVSELVVLTAALRGIGVVGLITPPIALLAAVEGGLRGFLRGSGLYGVQVTATLAYLRGALSFNLLNTLMLGVLLEGDLDAFINAQLYNFIMCEKVWPMGHWQTGRAHQYTLPITFGYGGGRPPVTIGPISSGPMPVTGIQVGIDRTRPRTRCLSLKQIIEELCKRKYLPRRFCPPAPARAAGSTGPCPVPTNFKQTKAEVWSGGRLYFEYGWDSSTGDLKDLKDCEVGEHVAYPNGDPYVWPSPPWDGKSKNPEVTWDPGTLGGLADKHTSKDFKKPYKEASFTATQHYRYKTPCANKGKPVNLMGPISIGRAVTKKSNGKFKYTITKSGQSASIDPLP